MQVVNKAATLMALSANPAMPSAAPDIGSTQLHMQNSFTVDPNHNNQGTNV